MSDDFPVAIKTRMWTFMAAKDAPTQEDRLNYASEIDAYLWVPMLVEIVQDGDPEDDGVRH